MDAHALTDFAGRLDRAYFVGNDYKKMAVLDQPLPIGYGQTISQPSLVLEMTYALDISKECNILEIGTGSGYQTALLAQFSKTVYTVECVAELAEKAKERLDALGYANIVYRTGDGSSGWPERAPFDRIIATAAASVLPQDLIDQLKPGGRMLAPVGSQLKQQLTLIRKDTNGRVETQPLEEVLFVEFKGKYGWID